MDQILMGVPRGSERPKWTKFSNWCLTMGGQRGRSGRNGSNSPIGAEQWGVKVVGGVEMDQILQLVLNNGGSRGPRGRREQILQFVPNNGGLGQRAGSEKSSK